MDKQQQSIDQQSVYQAGYGTIISKNFLAGFSRTLGAVVAQLLFFLVLFVLFARLFAPQLQPLFSMLERSLSTLESVQKLQEKGQSQTIDLTELVKQLEDSPTITR